MESDKTINLCVEIRRNADGVIVKDLWKDWKNFNAFWWDEGNAASDGNRELFFYRAQGLEADYATLPTGYGRYSVRLSNADTLEVLYDEFTEQEKRELWKVILFHTDPDRLTPVVKLKTLQELAKQLISAEPNQQSNLKDHLTSLGITLPE